MKKLLTLLAMLAAVGSFAQGTAIRSQNGFGTNTTLVTPTFVPNNGDLTPRILFPATLTGTDQPFVIQGSPTTSGASIAMQMLTTNTLFPLTPNGYGIWDPIAFQVISVGWQAPAGDGAGWNVVIGNGTEPIVVAHAVGAGSIPNIYTTGDTTNGFMFEVPYDDGVAGHNQPLPLRYDVTGTNYFFAPTNEPKLFEVNQNNGKVSVYNSVGTSVFQLLGGVPMTTIFGTLVTTGGQLSNGVAFNPSDISEVHFDSAMVRAGSYQTSGTASTNGFFSSDQSGWNTDGSGGMLFQSSGTGVYFTDATGIYPRVALDNTLILGTTGSTWKQVATHTLMMSSATNQSTGKFVLNGTTTVNIGNTTISAACTVVCWEALPNGGTASGIIIPVSQTASTGFAVKSIALDTSICNYIIVQNPF